MSVVVESHPWYDRGHHRPGGGFANVWDDGAYRPDVLRTMKWVLSHGFARKTHRPPPVRPLSAADLAAPPERLRITWIGHSSALLQTPARNVLVDPVFADRASPVSFLGPDRKAPLPFDPADLPRIDAVLLSHDHYDHLDRDAISLLQERHAPLFLTPLGVDDLIRRWGAERTAAFDWWQHADLGGWRVHCTPARHFSGRGLHDRDRTLWSGWYVEAPDADASVYYLGDSAYAPLFADVRERLGAADVALVPIGAYEPAWMMEPVHVNPVQAVQAFVDTGAAHGIGLHWGTFDLAEETIDAPAAAVREAAGAAGVRDRFHLLDIGGRFTLDPVPQRADD